MKIPITPRRRTRKPPLDLMRPLVFGQVGGFTEAFAADGTFQGFKA